MPCVPFRMGTEGLTLGGERQAEAGRRSLSQHGHGIGICAKPGDRVVLTDVKFDHNKIIFDLNGGPDPKHRFLRHIQIGGGVDDESGRSRSTANRPLAPVSPWNSKATFPN